MNQTTLNTTKAASSWPTSATPTVVRKNVRCAIYTRKSSEEGLGQEFNSLEAQRQSGEALIESRRGEGWTALAERYDDGGFSGGTMERPALQRLLADVRAGKIDVVVVYKLDRLARSIRDFIRIVEILDASKAVFVCVTQPFDTSSSAGRLTMNVLMSFSQFERELASDRTRDKIAAQRKRGQWAGGRPVLGYDLAHGKLTVNEAEAATVRRIFAMYLEPGASFVTVTERLRSEGVTTKRWTSRVSNAMGGAPLYKSTLSLMLSNPLYRGLVPHKDAVYPGQHAAIVDETTFAAVQCKLAEGRSCGAAPRQNKYLGLLRGILVCRHCGGAMGHDRTTKADGRDYRYYSCRTRNVLERGRCTTGSLPAEDLEQSVITKVRPGFAAPAAVTRVFDALTARHTERVVAAERRRTAHESQIRALDAVLAKTKDPRLVTQRQEAERGFDTAARELKELERSRVDRRAVEQGLHEFTPLWAALTLAERRALIESVVTRVVYDGVGGDITIEWQPTKKERA